MFNRCFDIAAKTVGIHFLIGGAYYLFFLATNFLSTFLIFLPYVVREFLIFGGAFAAAMAFLWKLSVSQGNKLEYENNFNKNDLIVGTVCGALADYAIFLIGSFIPRFTMLFCILHNYGGFPGIYVQNAFGLDEAECLRIFVLVDLPILVIIRILGLIRGRDVYIAKKEHLQELSEKRKKGESNVSKGRSWKESVGNEVANRAEFLKRRKG